MNWTKREDALPEDGAYVLCRMRDGYRVVNSNGSPVYNVLHFRRGLSLMDRGRMERGEIEDPIEISFCNAWPYSGEVIHRSQTHRQGDEGCNNLFPYVWGSENGHEVSHWTYFKGTE